jgi:hypothetical protein
MCMLDIISHRTRNLSGGEASRTREDQQVCRRSSRALNKADFPPQLRTGIDIGTDPPVRSYG